MVKAYKDEHFDVEIMREMGEMGFLGCTIDEYDLPGVSSVAYGKYFVLESYLTLLMWSRTHKQADRSS